MFRGSFHNAAHAHLNAYMGQRICMRVYVCVCVCERMALDCLAGWMDGWALLLLFDLCQNSNELLLYCCCGCCALHFYVYFVFFFPGSRSAHPFVRWQGCARSSSRRCLSLIKALSINVSVVKFQFHTKTARMHARLPIDNLPCYRYRYRYQCAQKRSQSWHLY